MSPFVKREDKRANDREWQARHDVVQMNTWLPRGLRDAIRAYCRSEGLTLAKFHHRAFTALSDGGVAKEPSLAQEARTMATEFGPVPRAGSSRALLLRCADALEAGGVAGEGGG